MLASFLVMLALVARQVHKLYRRRLARRFLRWRAKHRKWDSVCQNDGAIQMDKEFALQVSAMLGAHERLIRDLILARLEREEGPLDAIESYIERIRKLDV
jgi:hypothetical protein